MIKFIKMHFNVCLEKAVKNFKFNQYNYNFMMQYSGFQSVVHVPLVVHQDNLDGTLIPIKNELLLGIRTEPLISVGTLNYCYTLCH